MCNGHLSKEQVEKLHAICAERNNDPGELINILHAAQELLGYLPQVVQQVIAADLHIPVSRVYGVVTFYSFFTMEPKGKHPISVCLGTACYVRGAEKVLEEFQKELEIKVGETTSDGLFSLDTLRCVGACGLAPVVTIYHAGDKLDGEGRLVTSGGRVLGVTATAPTLKEALTDAYDAAETVEFEGKYMRHDIGRRALAAMEEQ